MPPRQAGETPDVFHDWRGFPPPAFVGTSFAEPVPGSTGGTAGVRGAGRFPERHRLRDPAWGGTAPPHGSRGGARDAGRTRHVPSHVDGSQRLPMYIVISKPKRISVNSGLVHMFPSSRTMGRIGSFASIACTGVSFRSNYRATMALSVPGPAVARSFNGLAAPRTTPGSVCPARFGKVADIDRSDWLK